MAVLVHQPDVSRTEATTRRDMSRSHLLIEFQKYVARCANVGESNFAAMFEIFEISGSCDSCREAPK